MGRERPALARSLREGVENRRMDDHLRGGEAEWRGQGYPAHRGLSLRATAWRVRQTVPPGRCKAGDLELSFGGTHFMRWLFWFLRFFGVQNRREDSRRRFRDDALAQGERAKAMKGQSGFQLDRDLREVKSTRRS